MTSPNNFMCCSGTGRIHGSGSAIFLSKQRKECPPVSQCCPSNQDNNNTNTSNPTNTDTNTNTSNPTNTNTSNPTNTFNPTIQVNPAITVNGGCPSECPSEREEQCQCSGFVNTQTDDGIVFANICPNCTNEGSTIIFPNFVAISISPPRCFPTTTGTHLDVTGTGVFDGVFGAYMFGLDESPGNPVVEFAFASVGPNSAFCATNAFPVTNGNLSITQCNGSSFASSSNLLPTQIPNTINNSINRRIGRKIIIHSDGQVEEKEWKDNEWREIENK